MKIINMARRNGKTTMLINAAYVNGAPIVVASEKRKMLLEEQAKSMGLRVEVYSLNDITMKRIHAMEFYVDDAEEVFERALMQLLGAPVRACTISVSYIDLKKEEKEDGQA